MVYLYQQPEDSGFPEFSDLGRAHSTAVIVPHTFQGGAIAFRDERPRFEEENDDGAPFKRSSRTKKRLEHRLEEKAQQNRPKSPTICILSSELVPRRVKAPPPELLDA